MLVREEQHGEVTAVMVNRFWFNLIPGSFMAAGEKAGVPVYTFDYRSGGKSRSMTVVADVVDAVQTARVTGAVR